jgi:hypothetical protein
MSWAATSSLKSTQPVAMEFSCITIWPSGWNWPNTVKPSMALWGMKSATGSLTVMSSVEVSTSRKFPSRTPAGFMAKRAARLSLLLPGSAVKVSMSWRYLTSQFVGGKLDICNIFVSVSLHVHVACAWEVQELCAVACASLVLANGVLVSVPTMALSHGMLCCVPARDSVWLAVQLAWSTGVFGRGVLISVPA